MSNKALKQKFKLSGGFPFRLRRFPIRYLL